MRRSGTVHTEKGFSNTVRVTISKHRQSSILIYCQGPQLTHGPNHVSTLCMVGRMPTFGVFL